MVRPASPSFLHPHSLPTQISRQQKHRTAQAHHRATTALWLVMTWGPWGLWPLGEKEGRTREHFQRENQWFSSLLRVTVERASDHHDWSHHTPDGPGGAYAGRTGRVRCVHRRYFQTSSLTTIFKLLSSYSNILYRRYTKSCIFHEKSRFDYHVCCTFV